MLGIARDFLHGGGHFVHGGGHLVGLDLLAVGAGAGLLGHRRQLLGGAGDLGDAVADAADQLAQGSAHAGDALLQHPQFVAAGNAQVLGEVAAGDLFHRHQGVTQRAGDLPGDQHCCQHTDQQRQQCGDGLQAAGLGAFDVAALQLDLVQRVAALDDVGALHGHFLAGDYALVAGFLEVLHCFAKAEQCRFELLDLRLFAW
ncbi:hypothetical protein D9M73_154790 [compost metagenome]